MPDFSNLLHGPGEWVLFFFCAMLIGMSKTGVQNIGTATIPVFALLFGAKHSTGIVLPMLCMADLLAVIYYRKKFHRDLVIKPMPWALMGLVVALILGHMVPESGFKILMGGCVLLGVVTMAGMNRPESLNKVTASRWFAPVIGFVLGFSTMIGNAAGPILTVYLLAMRLPKFAFVATGAWFIMILNYLKIPLQIFVWDNVSWAGFTLSLTALPFILVGGFVGIRIVHILPERHFKILMITLTIVSTLFLLI
ncbi:anion permease [Parapedobacter defluvii]|uniref:Probable membrane transporter protein n=1 Tax=Parapedobacter defluvii TaxID=2045106 RepID=A0ABQ1LTL7_9SPHI|nr:sulfite exporter TauE/SafE family protein [Parapedobacter defluvii]RQP16913.1 MAG: sulfite exporter TauE/SafE family protein [Parapedobacter sp.]GGC29616.1 anion permease [Parapedobacter defluvii]